MEGAERERERKRKREKAEDLSNFSNPSRSQYVSSNSAAGFGLCRRQIVFIPKARARIATFRPIVPAPITPTVYSKK